MPGESRSVRASSAISTYLKGRYIFGDLGFEFRVHEYLRICNCECVLITQGSQTHCIEIDVVTRAFALRLRVPERPCLSDSSWNRPLTHMGMIESLLLPLPSSVKVLPGGSGGSVTCDA